MDEKVINDLYSHATSKGYKKDINEFKILLQTNDKVLNDMYSYVQGKGYKKDINSFSELVGKQASSAPAVEKKNPVQSANTLPTGGENATVSSTETALPSTVSASESGQQAAPTPLASTKIPQVPTTDPNLIARQQQRQLVEQERIAQQQAFNQVPTRVSPVPTAQIDSSVLKPMPTETFVSGGEAIPFQRNVADTTPKKDQNYSSLAGEEKKLADNLLKGVYSDIFSKREDKANISEEEISEYIFANTPETGNPEADIKVRNAALEQVLGNREIGDNRFDEMRSKYKAQERSKNLNTYVKGEYGDMADALVEDLGLKNRGLEGEQDENINKAKVTLSDNAFEALYNKGAFVVNLSSSESDIIPEFVEKGKVKEYVGKNDPMVGKLPQIDLTKEQAKALYEKGNLSFRNPLSDPIFNAYVNEAAPKVEKQRTTEFKNQAIESYTGKPLSQGTKEENIAAFVKVANDVDKATENLDIFDADAKIIKKSYDRLIDVNNKLNAINSQISAIEAGEMTDEKRRELSILNTQREIYQDNVSQMQNEIEGRKENVLGYSTKLFDPLTGKPIDPSLESGNEPTIAKWNEDLNAKTEKYLTGYQGSLEEAKVDVYNKFKYYQDLILSQERFKEYHGDVTNGGVPYPFLESSDRLLNAYQDAASDLAAISRVEALNIDVQDMPRYKAAAFVNGLLDASIGGKAYKTSTEFVQDFVKVAEENGINLSEEQKERAKETFGEKAAYTGGALVPTMVEIIGATLLTQGTGTAAVITETANLLKGLKAVKDSQAWLKTINILEKAAQSGVVFDVAGQGFLTGVGESFGEGIGASLTNSIDLSKMFGSTKMGKVFGTMLNAFAKRAAGATGETLAEYTGEFFDELSKNDLTTAIANTVGEDYAEKLALMFMMTGGMSAAASVGQIGTLRNNIKEAIKSDPRPDSELPPIVREVKRGIMEAEKAIEKVEENVTESGTTETASLAGETPTETEPTKININPIVENIEGADTAYTDSEGKFYSKAEVISMIENGDEKVNGILLTNPSPEVVAALEKAKEVAPEKETTETVKEEGTEETPVVVETKIDEVNNIVEEDINNKIFVGGLMEGFTTSVKANKDSVQYKESFDPRTSSGENSGNSFVKTIEKRGKKYRTVGLRMSNPKTVLNRQPDRSGMSYASILDDGNLPNNIDELLIKKAIQEGKNLYEGIVKLEDSDFIIPNTETTAQATQAGEVQTETPTQNEIQQTEAQAEATPETVQVEETTLPGENQKRREDGSYTKDGVEYKRNEPTKGVVGKEGEVRFTEGTKEKFTYKLIEADELQPSHQGGRRNPNHFIPEAQPKNRTDDSSKLAEQGFATKPRFESLGADQDAYAGAPIVNERGEVIQGNNRSAGLKQGYKDGTHSYKENLAENAEQFGLTKEQVQGMKNPILVREVKVDDNKAIELGNYDVKDMETGGKSRIDPVTLSRRIPLNQKQKLTDVLFSDETKSLNDAIRSNEGAVIEAIRPFLNQAQRNSLVRDGKLTKEAINDIEALVKEFMFEGADTQLSDSFDNLPKTIQDGIKKSMPYIFAVDFKNNLITDVQTAITILNQFKASGVKNFSEWANQQDMFNDGKTPTETFSPLAMAIAGKINDSSKISDIVSIFKEYKEITQGTEADMFNEAKEGSSKKEATEKLFGTSDDNAKSTSVKTKPKEPAKPKEVVKPKETVKATEKTTETPKVESKPEVKKLADKLRSLKIDTKGKAFDATLGIPISVWNTTMDIIASGLEAGLSISEAIKKGIANLKSDNVKFDEKEFTDKMNEVLSEEETVVEEKPEPKKEEPKKPASEGGETKQSSPVKTVAKRFIDSGIDPELAERVAELSQKEAKTDKARLAVVDETIATLGLETAYQLSTNPTTESAFSQETKNYLAIAYADSLRQQLDTETDVNKRNVLINKIADAMNRVSSYGEDVGGVIQFFNPIYERFPEMKTEKTVVDSLNSQVKEAMDAPSDVDGQTVSETIEEVRESIKEELGKEFDSVIETLQEKIKERDEKIAELKENAENIRERKKNAKTNLSKHVSDLKKALSFVSGTASGTLVILNNDAIKAIANIVKDLMDLGVLATKDIINRVQLELSAAGISGVKDSDIENIANDVKAKKNKITNKEIREIFNEYFLNSNAATDSFIDYLADKLGYTPREIRSIFPDLESVIESKVKEVATKELSKNLAPALTAEQKAERAAKMREARKISNKVAKSIMLGNLSGTDFKNAFAEKYNIPVITEAQMQNLTDLVRLSKEFEKAGQRELFIKAQRKINTDLKMMKPKDASFFAKVIMEAAYLNALSGINTQGNANAGAMLTSGLNILAKMLTTSPAKTLYGFRAMVKSFSAASKSATEARKRNYSRFTDYNSYYEGSTAMEMGVIEQEVLKGTLNYFRRISKDKTLGENTINLLKSIGNSILQYSRMNFLLNAADAFLTTQYSEFNAALNAYNEVQSDLGVKEKIPFLVTGKDLMKTLDEKMGYDKKQDYQKQAEREIEAEKARITKEVDALGLSPQAAEIEVKKRIREGISTGYKTRRVQELMETSRGKAIQDAAVKSAKNWIMLNDPDGFLGVVNEFVKKTLTPKEGDASVKTIARTIGGLTIMFSRMTFNTMNAIVTSTPIVGAIPAVIGPSKDANDKWTGMFSYKGKHNKDLMVRRLMSNAIMTAIGTAVFAEMFEWDDEDKEWKLDPNRLIDITFGSYTGDKEKFKQGMEGYSGLGVSFAFRRNASLDFDNYKSFKLLPQSLPIMAIIGNYADKTKGIGSKESLDKFAEDKSIVNMRALGLSMSQLLEGSFNSIGQMTKSIQRQDPEDYEWVGLLATELTLQPLKGVLQPNFYRDALNEFGARGKYKKAYPKNWYQKLAFDFWAIDNMYDSEIMTDRFGNPVESKSKVSMWVNGDHNNANHNNKEWEVVFKYPSVTISPYKVTDVITTSYKSNAGTTYKYAYKIVDEDVKREVSEAEKKYLKEFVLKDYDNLMKLDEEKLQKSLDKKRDKAVEKAKMDIIKKYKDDETKIIKK
jgi:hypothetical protein